MGHDGHSTVRDSFRHLLLQASWRREGDGPPPACQSADIITDQSSRLMGRDRWVSWIVSASPNRKRCLKWRLQVSLLALQHHLLIWSQGECVAPPSGRVYGSAFSAGSHSRQQNSASRCTSMGRCAFEFALVFLHFHLHQAPPTPNV